MSKTEMNCCGDNKWVIFKGDVLTKVHPVFDDTLKLMHECDKLAVYQKVKGLQRRYVIKEIESKGGENTLTSATEGV